jgi:hypothetical protein
MSRCFCLFYFYLYAASKGSAVSPCPSFLPLQLKYRKIFHLSRLRKFGSLSQNTSSALCTCSVPCLRSSKTRESLILRGFQESRRRKSISMFPPLLILIFCCLQKHVKNLICAVSLPPQFKYQRILDPSRLPQIPPPKECFDVSSSSTSVLLSQKCRADTNMSCSSASAAHISEQRLNVFLACLCGTDLQIERIYLAFWNMEISKNVLLTANVWRLLFFVLSAVSKRRGHGSMFCFSVYAAQIHR